ncbi:MAG: hypothetical protein WCC70_12065 [Candidatus Aquilonibacter sp.]
MQQQSVQQAASPAQSFTVVKRAAVAHQTSAQSAPNLFAEGRGLSLTDSDLDTYIDPAVTGNDRVLAHKFMAMMPPNQRGDFVYLASDGHLVSNNPAALPFVTVTHSTEPVAQATMSRTDTSSPATHRMDYSNSCSPPNPPSSPGGPYARNVSECTFTAGLGFVNVPCGTTILASGDAGHLYFELQGSGIGTGAKSLVEGGLEYYSDTSVAPYLRSSAVSSNSGYVTMTNNSTRYGCGQNLVIEHGATSNGTYTYTQVGQLPSQYDPETSWVNYGIFTNNNASWLFLNQPGDITGSGIDYAGVSTPCQTCSISQVTSIAQNGLPSGTGYSVDGSWFGIDQNGAEIHWMQVAFGEWQSNCVPNTTLCTFVSSPYISQYAGGSQFYPNVFVSETYQNPLGYGPYETYDGIDLQTGGVPASEQRAGGPFDEPTPPPPTPTPAPTATPVPTVKPSPTVKPCIVKPCPQVVAQSPVP